MNQNAARFSNHLLRSLSPSDLSLLAGGLVETKLAFRLNLEMPGQPIHQVCFPDSGIISVVAHNGRGGSIEAGLIGFEGMTGAAILLGDDRSPNETYVQMAGLGHVISADRLRSALKTSETLGSALRPFLHAFMIQTAQTALANGRAKIDERLARWLLMAADRSDGRELSLTHEFLSLMLAVRRPGVTDAIHRLEGDHLIRARRATIMIRDREGLERVAGGSYGVSEAEYKRLYGVPGFASEPLQSVRPA